jgi:CBS domain-containing protein
MSNLRQILQLKSMIIWEISPNASVFDALRLMADKDVGAIVVMEGGKMVGILSERDYARKVILHGKSSRETRVSEIMTSNVITIHPDQTVQEALDLMASNRIRHLPVVDEDSTVLGMISIMDVVRNLIHTQRQKIRDLENRIFAK